MKNKVYCPVCRVAFVYREEITVGMDVVCPVCGAKLEITSISEVCDTRRFPQEPETEIRERVDNYARLRSYVFKENKEEIIEGLLEKYKQYGDFYCPCRFDNVPENICPCDETRKGAVKEEGSCL